METGEKYFCRECIDKKINVGLLNPLDFYYTEKFGKDWAYDTSIFQLGGKCTMCGNQDDNIPVLKHPEMEMFMVGRDND